jgi:flagellar hook-basal body protein
MCAEWVFEYFLIFDKESAMSFYTSLTGLNAATAQLGVTSNNIANVGTTSFKRSRADFGDIFASSPLQKSSSNIGQGVSLNQVTQEFTQGNIMTTGNVLDLAITGDGFFPLRSADGLQDLFTRNGSFTLNLQNNVVNSAGQRLLAAEVDSSGKADLSKLNVLVIPPKTLGQARETTQIQLGINFPADAEVIDLAFDRNNPATYNKSTALTVYDAGGNGYLATVYYVKTANPNPNSLNPQSKWQTHVYVGNAKVEPALMQALDKNGERLFVNKYGDLKPESEIQDQLTSVKSPMFSLDDLTDLRTSVPASVRSDQIVLSNGRISVPALSGTQSFKISVDGSQPVLVNLNELFSPATPTLPEDLARELTLLINKKMGDNITPATITPPSPAIDERRYGLEVKFDAASRQFVFSSGTTGDTSSFAITDPTSQVASLLGLTGEASKYATEISDIAARGKPSLPAVLRGEVVGVNTSANVSVNELNNAFSVTVDGVRRTVVLDPGSDYTMSEIASLLEQGINSSLDLAKVKVDRSGVVTADEDFDNESDPNTGKVVRGVQVEFDPVSNRLVFTTGTTGDSASIRVVGSGDWGLANAQTVRGETSKWFQLRQFTELVDGQPRLQYIDAQGQQTSLRDGFESLPTWSPIFLDKGELSFDLRGRLVSPSVPMAFNRVFLEGGRGALQVDINFAQSTQFASPFSVLSQSQDGAPEGELLGLDIGADGLISANYSNGTQNALGKVVLANFASPTNLRQLGDTTFLATANSGAPKIGEAGSAGFGSIRAGATERSNVDLTQELVDLITAQRSFQANAKAIETSSTMTQAIINIRS